MRCPKCGGELVYEEEVSGFFTYSISEDGVVDYSDRDFEGDSWVDIKCSDCSSVFDFDWDYDKDNKIILEEEVFNG